MIKTSGLRKSFRSGKAVVEAVRGVDLDVGDGEIFGFLGPNGAGKTTTLRMLATLIRPDGGSALVAGVDLMQRPAEVRRRIGYVAQGGGTWEEVSAREELVYQGRLHRRSTPGCRRRGAGAAGGSRCTGAGSPASPPRSPTAVPPPRSRRSSSASSPTARARPTPAASAA